MTTTINTTTAAVLPGAPSKQAVWTTRLSEIFWINSVAISSKGDRIVAATYLHDYLNKTEKGVPKVFSRFGTRCYDATGAEPRDQIWSDEEYLWDGIFGVAISGDGKTAAAAGWSAAKNGGQAQGLLRAYNADDGTRLLNFTDVMQRVSWVNLSADGLVLAAVADDVYLFFRKAGQSFNPKPIKLGIDAIAGKYVTNVAVHPDGTWLVACDKIGHVFFATIKNGAVDRMFQWTAPGGLTIPLLSVAIAPQTKTVVAGGGNSVFVFDFGAILLQDDGKSPSNVPVNMAIEYDTRAGDDAQTVPPDDTSVTPAKIAQNVRWVGISADGQLVAAVANRSRQSDGKGFGVVVAVKPVGGKLIRLWRQETDNFPNGMSVAADGRYVGVADGYPTCTPSKFYLFDDVGTKLWDFGTFNMNWPIAISEDGTAIAAGGDDGTLYYFKP